MGTKETGDSCYDNALPDEPFFILLARDPIAPMLTLIWASIRRVDINSGQRPESDRIQANEAEMTSIKMSQWRNDNLGNWRK